MINIRRRKVYFPIGLQGATVGAHVVILARAAGRRHWLLSFVVARAVRVIRVIRQQPYSLLIRPQAGPLAILRVVRILPHFFNGFLYQPSLLPFQLRYLILVACFCYFVHQRIIHLLGSFAILRRDLHFYAVLAVHFANDQCRLGFGSFLRFLQRPVVRHGKPFSPRHVEFPKQPS